MTTPNDVQTQINQVPWNNKQNLITGGTISTLLTAIVALFAYYAPLVSPNFTGTPKAPTAACLDYSTTLATTAFARCVLPASVTAGEVYESEIGDSRAQLCSSVSGTPGVNAVYANSPLAFCGWVAFETNQAIRHPASYNCAAYGTTTSALMGQFNTCILALNPLPKFMEILSGTNDFGNGVLATTAWANVSAVVIAARKAGIVPICIYDLTRTLSTWTQTDAQQSNQFNELMRMNGPALGCLVVNSNYQLMDAANIGDWLSGYSPDGVHTLPRSAILIANNIVTLLTNLGILPLANTGAFTVATADQYTDGVNVNPYGNKLPNQLFNTTTGGSNSANGGSTASGPVPSGWQNRILTGTATSVSSTVAPATGKPGNCWQLVITDTGGTGSTGRMELYNDLQAGTDYAAGTKMWFAGDLSWSGATGLLDMSPNIGEYTTNPIFTAFDSATALNTPNYNGTLYPFPAAASGRFRTDTITSSATAVSAFIPVRISWQLAANGSATFKACGLEVRQAQ